MNKYVLSIALLVASTGAFAQNRLVKKAQGLIKNNQIEEAQTLLTEALNSGETKDMALAWDVQGDLYQRLFADELNKAAAHHQPLDTAKFAKICMHVWTHTKNAMSMTRKRNMRERIRRT